MPMVDDLAGNDIGWRGGLLRRGRHSLRGNNDVFGEALDFEAQVKRAVFHDG